MNLNVELRRLYEESRSRRSPEDAEIVERAAQELRESGISSGAKAVGDFAPRFTLPNAAGSEVALDGLLRHGPVVLSFYRGGWCPYCNLELRALQASIGDLEARGARLVAISPQIPDESLSVAEKHGLSFEVLSDVGATVAREYGLSFDVPVALANVYEKRDPDFARKNGGYNRTLVVPATYVVKQNDLISWAFVNTDHTKRAEPSSIIAALDAVTAERP